jgi:heat shock protein HslJ
MQIKESIKMRVPNNFKSRWLIRLAGLSVVIVLALVACTPAATPTPSNSIQGIVWQWVSVTNQTTKETTTVSNPENYTIIFNADGTLTGKADCNSFTGTYSQQNGFTIKLGATTMAYCGEASLDHNTAVAGQCGRRWAGRCRRQALETRRATHAVTTAARCQNDLVAVKQRSR